MDHLKEKEHNDKEARRLRELFRGRFDQDTAVMLIMDLGGLLPAVDFVLKENEETVSRFLKKSTTYLQSMRDDSRQVASILENKIEDSVRQFVCGDCKRSWWKRVPLRKEVSKCRRCNVKYDPLPREHESGIGSFKCPCGNEFTGFASMGETISECYQCGAKVPVDCMIPPRRNRERKSRKPHSCNGVNCHNPSHDHGQSLTDLSHIGAHADMTQGLQSYAGADLDRYMTSSSPTFTMGRGRWKEEDRQSQGGYIPDTAPTDPVPVCVHPKAQKRVIRHVSKKHISTGSTVSTFLSQNSIDTQSISVAPSLYSIDE
ncbi:hypothetical protein BsWGS_00982 [Bradybaena similaris]